MRTKGFFERNIWYRVVWRMNSITDAFSRENMLSKISDCDEMT